MSGEAVTVRNKLSELTARRAFLPDAVYTSLVLVKASLPNPRQLDPSGQSWGLDGVFQTQPGVSYKGLPGSISNQLGLWGM